MPATSKGGAVRELRTLEDYKAEVYRLWKLLLHLDQYVERMRDAITKVRDGEPDQEA
jgi:hypothetical protein